MSWAVVRMVATAGSSAACRCTASAPHHAAHRLAWSLSGGSGGLGPAARSRHRAAARRAPAPAAGRLVPRSSRVLLSLGRFVAAPCRPGSSSLPRSAGQKKARIARAKFSRSGRLSRTGGRVDGGRRGKGSGHMMGRWYPPPSPPTVHPTGRVSGGRGEALAPISAAGRRRGPGPGGGRARRRRGGDEGVRGRGEPRPRGASSLPAREKCTLSDPGRLGSERRGPQLVGGLASYDPGRGRSG